MLLIRLHLVLGCLISLFSVLPASLTAQLLTVDDGGSLTITENSVVTVKDGNVEVDFGGTLQLAGTLDVTGSAELFGTINLALRSPEDYGLFQLTGAASMQDATLTVQLVNGYTPEGLVVHSWLTSDTDVDGPFDVENLPGPEWYTEFDNERHAVIFNVALPVEWLSFTGQTVGKSSRLDWSTSAEVNADFYEVQRLNTLQQWEAIGRVDANGSTELANAYQYFDHSPGPTNPVYYRLRQVDYDGTFSFSDIVEVTFPGSSDQVQLYPNPTPDNLHVTVAELQQDAPLPFRVIDASGRQVLAGQLTATGGQPAKIVLPGQLPTGTYTLLLGERKGIPFIIRR